MSDQTVDFGNGQSMVFRKYVPERIKPKALRDFPIGATLRYVGRSDFIGTSVYTRVDISGTPGYYVNGCVMPADNAYPWWLAESDVNPDGTVKFVDVGNQRTYGSLVAGDVFQHLGYVYVLRAFINSTLRRTALTNVPSAICDIPWDSNLIVKYLGRFEFSR